MLRVDRARQRWEDLTGSHVDREEVEYERCRVGGKPLLMERTGREDETCCRSCLKGRLAGSLG